MGQSFFAFVIFGLFFTCCLYRYDVYLCFLINHRQLDPATKSITLFKGTHTVYNFKLRLNHKPNGDNV